MNANVLVSTVGMSNEVWREFRKKGIGGSDVSAIAGLNKYRSPISVWLEKTGQYEPEEPGESAYWGTLLEEVVAKEFSTRTGLKVQRRNAILQHPQYPFMIANLDRVIVDKERGQGILECKTAGEFMAGAWEDEKIPDSYMLQVQHYLAVTGLAYAYIAVLIGGNKFKHKLIERDEEIIEHLIKIESDFWSMVEKGIPPEMDGSESSTNLLKSLYPESKADSIIQLHTSAELLIDEYEKAAADEKDAAFRKEEAANQLKNILKDSETGVVNERRVTWKSFMSSRFDSKALKVAHPDIYKKYNVETLTRRFSIK